MHSVQFNEEQLGDIQQLLQSCFEDENDPRSNSYQRILSRPKINWFHLLLWIAVPLTVVLTVCFAPIKLFGSRKYVLFLAAVLIIVFELCTVKKAAIFVVKVYQRLAPDSIRMKCRFEPSCSEYMILSIEKFGVIKGVFKGISRLKRCNIDGGGFDYP